MGIRCGEYHLGLFLARPRTERTEWNVIVHKSLFAVTPDVPNRLQQRKVMYGLSSKLNQLENQYSYKTQGTEEDYWFKRKKAKNLEVEYWQRKLAKWNATGNCREDCTEKWMFSKSPLKIPENHLQIWHKIFIHIFQKKNYSVMGWEHKNEYDQSFPKNLNGGNWSRLWRIRQEFDFFNKLIHLIKTVVEIVMY